MKVSLFVVVFLLFVVECFSQSFDLNQTKLPLNFVGLDPVVTFKKLSESEAVLNATRGKSSFETTEAYNARLAKVKNTPLFGSTTTDTLVYFTLDYADDKYNADTKKMSVDLSFDLEPYSDGLALNLGDKKLTGTSVGQNSYGATATIRKYERTSYYLKPNARLSQSEFSFIVEPEKAKEIYYSGLKVLVVGKLAAPFIKTKENLSTPTLNNPEMIASSDNQLVMDVVAIWLYNEKTGEVYLKKAFTN